MLNTQQHLQAVHIVIYQLRKKRMQKTVLNEVFELLQQIGAVSSESEFSKDWLCRSECYIVKENKVLHVPLPHIQWFFVFQRAA